MASMASAAIAPAEEKAPLEKMPSSEKMAFLGLGQMGQAMTAVLTDRVNLAHPLKLWNRSPAVATQHGAAIGSSQAVETLRDAVDPCDIVWSCLSEETAVASVYREIVGSTDVKDKIFVECSTMPPHETDAVAEIVRSKGGVFIAMPVFGEPKTAAAGKMIVVPAGPAAAVERIRPFLAGVLASAVVDFSNEPPSQASLLKLIGNVLIMTTIEQVAELLVFAEKSELGVGNVQKLLAALYPGGPQQHLTYSGIMASGEWHRRTPIINVGAAIPLVEKVLGMAGGLGVELKAYKVALEHLKDVRKEASSEADILGIYGAVRAESGLPFKSQ